MGTPHGASARPAPFRYLGRLRLQGHRAAEIGAFGGRYPRPKEFMRAPRPRGRPGLPVLRDSVLRVDLAHKAIQDEQLI